MKTRLLFLLFLPLLAAAETPEVMDIVLKAEQAAYYAGEDGVADVHMVIHDADGSTRERDFRILRWNGEDGEQKFYVYFRGPAEVRRMAYLVWKHPGDKEDDRWLWLPAIGKVNRIAPGDKRTAFVGSDFVYEDVSGRSPYADTHELIGRTEDQYHIRSTPKNPDEVKFDFYEVWIDKETFLPMKAEYTNPRGEVYRTVTADKVETIQGYPTVVVSSVEDTSRDSKTVNTFSNIRYNVGLDERLFSERFLRRPPREAVR